MRRVFKIRLAFTLLALVTGFGLVRLLAPRRLNPLGAVVEPISIVDAISWDDGGSLGLKFKFKDARQVTRYVCLMNDLEGHENLVVGSYTPIHETGRLKETNREQCS